MLVLLSNENSKNDHISMHVYKHVFLIMRFWYRDEVIK